MEIGFGSASNMTGLNTDKCQDLKRVNRKMWGCEKRGPTCFRALRSVTKKGGQWIEALRIRVARILKMVIDF